MRTSNTSAARVQPLLSIRSAMLFFAAMIVIKSLVGLIALKVQASILAPSSFAILSQFMTIANLVTNISSAAVITGMTVLLARSESQADVGHLIVAGEWFSAGVSCVISLSCVILFVFGKTLINISPLPAYLYLILAISPWLITRSSIAQARLTSAYRLDQFAKLSNVSVITVAGLIIVLTLYFGLLGGAIAAAVGPMIAATILLLFAANKPFSRDTAGAAPKRVKHVRELLQFSSAMLVAVCAVPISHLLVRDSMVGAGAIEQAGFWSSTVRLSDVYMQFFGLLLTAFILPKISSQAAQSQSTRLFGAYLGRIALTAAAIISIVLVLREYLVALALAPEYGATASLLKTQLPADFLRVVLSFFFWFAYGQNLRVLAATEEILQACLFFMIFKFGYQGADAQGAVSAHLIASLINTLIVGTWLWLTLSKRQRN